MIGEELSVFQNWLVCNKDLLLDIVSPVVTFIGGYVIAKKSFSWQSNQQQKIERKYMFSLVGIGLDELAYNQSMLESMYEAFKENNGPSDNHWKWLGTIADSLRFESMPLILNNLTKPNNLSRAIQHLYVAYGEVLACYHQIKEGYAKYRFFTDDIDNSTRKKKDFNDVKENLYLTIKGLESYREIVDEELEEKSGGDYSLFDPY